MPARHARARCSRATPTPSTSSTGATRGTTPRRSRRASACSPPASPRRDCWLTPAPREPEHPREFLATIVLGPHVQQLPEELRERFMDDVLAQLGEPVVVDYVRLNIDAVA